MKIIKIFVASSKELTREREVLADMVGHLNYSLNKIGVCILLIKWEYLDESMGALHKQEEYNQKLKDCEICMVLYWTKLGKYTKIELETAYSQLKAGHNPRKLYVYFKDSDLPLSPQLKQFKDNFPDNYGHFYSVFGNEDALKSHFLLQFIDYQNSLQEISMSDIIEVKDSKVMVSGRESIDLNNVEFVGNNDEYKQLFKLITRTRKLLAVTDASDPDYLEYKKELTVLTEKQQRMEKSLWNTALTITRLSNEASSKRLKHAIELFNKGDNHGANAILDETDIDHDINNNLRNIELGKTGLKNNIAELKLKIDILCNEFSEGWREKCEDIHKKIVSLTAQVYGIYSEEYSVSLLDIGSFYHNIGRHNDALICDIKALNIHIKLFGEEHHHVAESYNNIGLIYLSLNNYSKALKYYEKALKIWLKILKGKPDNKFYSYNSTEKRNLAACYNNIGIIYKSQCDSQKALEFFEQSLRIRLELFGYDHPEVAESYNNIGTVYQEQGNFGKALSNFNESLRIRLKFSKENHPEIARTYYNIGTIYSFQGECHQALRYHEKALGIRLHVYGEYDINVAASYFQIGRIYLSQGDYMKALEYNEKVLTSQRENIDNPIVANSYNSLGLIYHSQGDYAKALEYFNKALQILLKVFNDDHIDVAESYNGIGLVYYSQSDYAKALEYLEKALQIIIKSFGEKHPNVAKNYNGLGLVYYSQGDYTKALEYFDKALQISLKIFGENHPDVASCYNNIGMTYYVLYDYAKALKYLEKALDIQIEFFGDSHHAVSATKKIIELVNYMTKI